jgi:hypothetical protein
MFEEEILPVFSNMIGDVLTNRVNIGILVA